MGVAGAAGVAGVAGVALKALAHCKLRNPPAPLARQEVYI